MPLRELQMRRRTTASQWRIVHDVILQQRKGLQQLQSGASPEGRSIGFGSAQPPQVHEGRAKAFTAINELHQDVGGDIDSGAIKLRHALGVDEMGHVGKRRLPHPVAPDLELGARRRTPRASRRGGNGDPR